MDDGLYILLAYRDEKKESLQAIRNLQGISSILTSLAFPFSCAATIRGTITESSREVECGWIIRGRFGTRMRTMRIDSIQYDETGGTFVIRAVHNDLWVMSHRIGANMDRISRFGLIEIDARDTQLQKSFTGMVQYLYQFLEGECEPPRFTGDLVQWPVTNEIMISVSHCTFVLDEMSNVISLYRPAWEAGEIATASKGAPSENVVFSDPRTYILNSAVGMCRVISTGKDYAPNFGYGSGGGKVWAKAELPDVHITYGGYYERIYDAHDVYIAENLQQITAGMLKQDAYNANWWEIEVINTNGQDIWIGDMVAGDFTRSQPAVVVSIDYEQTGSTTRTYMRLGRAPASIAERLVMLRRMQLAEKEKFRLQNTNGTWAENIGL